ncbi:Non-structural maintenance of chromosomes element 1 [Dinochytrium kinnereticum]|nr:Non-structural maintenance of chromosomes element 1 [Dinochytrium kinnereticum]
MSGDSDGENHSGAKATTSHDPSRFISPAFQKVHRLFLHCWLSIKFGTDEQALSLFKFCCNKHDVEYNKKDFPDFAAVINEVLFSLDMKFFSAISPENGSKYWALVNVHSDDSSQLATALSIQELAFFKRVIALIVNAESKQFQIRNIEALNESSKVKPPVTKKNAEAVVEGLIRNQWLNENLNVALRQNVQVGCINIVD